LLPLALAAATPAPASSDMLPVVPVRCELIGGYGRLSFLWTDSVDYKMTREGPDVVVAFRQPARIEPGSLAHERSACARWIGWRPVDGGVIVTMRLPEGNEARDARLGNRIVIDVFPTPEPLRPPPASSPMAPEAVAPASSTSPTAAATSGEASANAMTTLRFSWPAPTAAAVGLRDRTMWIVFDQPSRQDTDLLRRLAGERRVAAIRQRPHPGATVLELTMTGPVFPFLEKDGLAWIVHLAPTRRPATAEAIVPLPVGGDREPGHLVLPVAEPAAPVAFTDPAGGTLVFVPLREVGRGISRAFTYAEARLLASPQGIAVAPLADDLSVRSLPDGVELSRPNGLSVSPVSEAARVLARLQAADGVDRIVPEEDWPAGSLAAVRDRQQDANGITEDVGTEASDLRHARLARFYLAAGLGAEALGVTETRLARRPELIDDAETRLIAGIARYSLARLEEAAADFATVAVAATDEGRMWAALTRHAAEDREFDRLALPVWTTLIATYPEPLARIAGLALLDAVVAGGEVTTARALVAGLRVLAPTTAEIAALDYQEGRLHAAAGETDAALAAWDRIPATLASRQAAEAALARIALLRRSGRMRPDEAADALAGLQVRWRGDRVEFQTLRDLGQAQADGGDGLAALQAWRDAVSLYDREPESRELGRKMATYFRDAFLSGGVDTLPPWQAVLLFDGFKELVPAEAGGFALLNRYADLLVAADLLPRATEVFERLLKSPLSPQQRGETGLRLAETRLADRAAGEALEVLKRTEHAELAADLQAARRRAAARAQLSLGRPAEALALLERDEGEAADTIRLGAQRAKGDWAGAAATLGRQQPHGLDLAAAMTLAKDEDGLARLLNDPGRAGEAAADMAIETVDAVRLMATPPQAVPPRPDAVAAAVAAAERLAKLTRAAVGQPAQATPSR
jgi:hypothetical protein